MAMRAVEIMITAVLAVPELHAVVALWDHRPFKPIDNKRSGKRPLVRGGSIPIGEAAMEFNGQTRLSGRRDDRRMDKIVSINAKKDSMHGLPKAPPGVVSVQIWYIVSI